MDSRDLPRLIPVPKWPEYHLHPTVSGLRFLIFNEFKNGFHDCVVRIGRRVLIDETKYFKWVAKQQNNGGNNAV